MARDDPRSAIDAYRKPMKPGRNSPFETPLIPQPFERHRTPLGEVTHQLDPARFARAYHNPRLFRREPHGSDAVLRHPAAAGYGNMVRRGEPKSQRREAGARNTSYEILERLAG